MKETIIVLAVHAFAFLILWGWYVSLKVSEKDDTKVKLADRLQSAFDSLMKEKKMAYFEPPALHLIFLAG